MAAKFKVIALESPVLCPDGIGGAAAFLQSRHSIIFRYKIKSIILYTERKIIFTGTLKFKMAFKVLFLLMPENGNFYYFCDMNKYFTKK